MVVQKTALFFVVVFLQYASEIYSLCVAGMCTFSFMYNIPVFENTTLHLPVLELTFVLWPSWGYYDITAIGILQIYFNSF